MDYGNKCWTNAIIVKQCNPVTYIVKTSDNRYWKRHIDQLRLRRERNLIESNINTDVITDLSSDSSNSREASYSNYC